MAQTREDRGCDQAARLAADEHESQREQPSADEDDTAIDAHNHVRP